MCLGLPNPDIMLGLPRPEAAEFRRWCATADLQDSVGMELLQKPRKSAQ